jgi:anti-sigma factor RsiW
MTRRDFTERDIHMAIDGELPTDELADYQTWLDGNPEMKARSIRFEADRDRLRQAFSDIVMEQPPERLQRLVRGEQTVPSVARGRWRTVAAAAIIFAVGGIGGYFAGAGLIHSQDEAEDLLAEEAINAHTIYAAEQRHAVEVGSDEKGHLLGWLSKRIGLTLIAPDLTAEGFDLVGGRLLPAGRNTAALLLYEDKDGARISVFVTAEAGATAKGTYQMAAGGPSAVYWLDDGYGCAIVGTLPREQLAKLARNAYRQLLVGAGKA